MQSCRRIYPDEIEMADTDELVNRTVFLTLPDETLVYMLRHLHHPDLISLSRCCKRMRRLCGDDVLWRWQCVHYFLDHQCTEGLSWNQHFITLYKQFGKYPAYKELKMAWDKIKKYLKKNCPTIFSKLLDGVNENILNELEETLGHALPVDIRVSYRLCNGQILHSAVQGLLGGTTLHNFSSTFSLIPVEIIMEECQLAEKLGLLQFACSEQSYIYYAFSDHGGFTAGSVYIPYSANYDEPIALSDFFCAGTFKDMLIDYANKLDSNKYYVKNEYINKFYHEPDCIATTSGITVKPTVCFVPELSRKPSYFFVYRIIISMSDDTPRELSCQLETRHWVITDGSGEVEFVNGPGVIGEHPIMKPGAEFSWISCCTFDTPSGNMKGRFRFKNLATGDAIDVECPCFHMEALPVLTYNTRDESTS